MQDMAVRGAPALAIAAALGLVVELINNGSGMQFETAEAARDRIIEQAEYLVTRCAPSPHGERCSPQCRLHMLLISFVFSSASLPHGRHQSDLSFGTAAGLQR